jgi:sugar phosphate isomerase/epimerase
MTNIGERTIALCPLTVTELSAIETADVARAAGYDAIGLRFWKADAHGNVLADNPALLKRTLDHIAALDLVIYDLTVITLDAHTHAEVYIPTLDGAASTGAHNIVVVGRDPERNRFEDEFARLCEAAAPLGLSAHLEFMATSEVRSLGEAAAICSKVSSGNAHILLDSLHLFRSGGKVEELASIDPHLLVYMQLSDGPPSSPDLDNELRHARLNPGEGSLPLAKMLKALPATMPISVEVPQLARQEAGVSALERAAESLEATRKLLALADRDFGDGEPSAN